MINIRPLLKSNDLDTILILSPKLNLVDPAFTYFTGLLDYEKALYIGGKTQKAYVSSFEVPRAKKDSGVEILPRPKKGFEQLFKKLKGKKVGINGRALPAGIYKSLRRYGLRLKDISLDLVDMMAIKTPAEIVKIKEAIRLTKGMFRLVEEGKSELDIAADMAHYLMKRGA
ncbi:MAG: aminopeptidase P family N-terminal domain-containing protein, partial [archaeon]